MHERGRMVSLCVTAARSVSPGRVSVRPDTTVSAPQIVPSGAYCYSVSPMSFVNGCLLNTIRRCFRSFVRLIGCLLFRVAAGQGDVVEQHL